MSLLGKLRHHLPECSNIGYEEHMETLQVARVGRPSVQACHLGLKVTKSVFVQHGERNSFCHRPR